MESIYKIISENPGYFTWAFGLVNFLWFAFTYFNKKSHDKEIESIKHSFSLMFERKKKVFGMKSESYESYFKEIDAYFKKHQDDLETVFTPILQEFLARSVNSVTEQESGEAIIWFNNELSKFSVAGLKEFQALDQQTNTLQLTSNQEVAEHLECLRRLYSEMFEVSNELLKAVFESLQGNSEQKELIISKQKLISENILQEKRKLILAMRRDLEII